MTELTSSDPIRRAYRLMASTIWPEMFPSGAMIHTIIIFIPRANTKIPYLTPLLILRHGYIMYSGGAVGIPAVSPLSAPLTAVLGLFILEQDSIPPAQCPIPSVSASSGESIRWPKAENRKKKKEGQGTPGSRIGVSGSSPSSLPKIVK